MGNHRAAEGYLIAALAVTVTLLAMLPAAASIKCFHCNSVKDDHCEHLQANKTASQHYLKDCKDLVPENVEPFCRKVVQTIVADGSRRVIRRCGYEKSPKPCYRYDNEDHAEVVCQCFDEACNAASGLGQGSLTSALIATSSAALLLLLAR